MTPNSAQKFNQSPHVSTKQFEDELLLLHRETGDYYSLNRVGHQIWDYCFEAKTAQEIIKFVISRHEASEKEVQKDVNFHLEMLVQEKLFEVI